MFQFYPECLLQSGRIAQAKNGHSQIAKQELALCRYDLERRWDRRHRKGYTQRDTVRFAAVGKDLIDRTTWNIVSILL